MSIEGAAMINPAVVRNALLSWWHGVVMPWWNREGKRKWEGRSR
jgi:hypothetical protein